ncbi:MAG: hypothetical protein PHC95_08965 [Parabacteroides sp.]|nr:hypothetical protein [Parabacteroides sp.]
MKEFIQLTKSEKEKLGFKRIMTQEDFVKILQELGYLYHTNYTVGKFANKNGYEKFKKTFSGRIITLYKEKGTPTPNLVRKTYDLENA